jgi:hypothetical protein
MKKILLIHTLLLSAFLSRGQVFIGTEPTGNPVLLEVKSDDRGVLIPRIHIPDTSSPSPVTAPQNGLLVMNIRPGHEGLFFWNNGAWEKLKTEESVRNELSQTGKKIVFVGTEDSGTQPVVSNDNTDILLRASWGTLTADKKKYTVQENGVYEITAGFTGTPNQKIGFLALIIYNHTQASHLAYNTVSQGSNYSDIGSKAVYCGPLKAGDEIGLRLFYGTDGSSTGEKLKTAFLSIKKINGN